MQSDIVKIAANKDSICLYLYAIKEKELIRMAKSTYIPPRDWTPEQVQAKLEDLIDHVERLKDDWWDDDLKGLINVHEIGRASCRERVYVSV